MLLTLILWIAEHKSLATQTSKNKKSQNVSSDVNSVDGSGTSEDIENLSIVAKSAKSKMSKFTKSKKPDSNFAKINSSKTDFLASKAKKTFIHLQKAFT